MMNLADIMSTSRFSKQRLPPTLTTPVVFRAGWTDPWMHLPVTRASGDILSAVLIWGRRAACYDHSRHGAM
jgi:hypothetical protein